MSSASRRARLPPRISFIIRSAITWFASTAKNIKELIIRRLYIADHQDERAEMVPDSRMIKSAAEPIAVVRPAGLTMSALRGWSQPIDATLYLEGEMECGLMGHKFHRGFTAAEKTEL
jgi:hypothetical protein